MKRTSENQNREMEPKEKKRQMGKSLAQRRMDALEKGKFNQEDLIKISFLVGAQDSTAQEIHAYKIDLMVASEYFEGLLRSPSSPAEGPIRLKLVEPDIFRLVVETTIMGENEKSQVFWNPWMLLVLEQIAIFSVLLVAKFVHKPGLKFIHLSGQLVSRVSDLEQCLKLAKAADEFLLDELGQLSTRMLDKLINVDNVWTVFSQHHLIKYSSAACVKLLCSRTVECLEAPAFLKIEEDALAKFLSLDIMTIKSEMQLVLACLDFVKGKKNKRALFRRCALPYLRLLTLEPEDDLATLIPFLEREEKMAIHICITMKMDPLQLQKDLLASTNLCKVQKPRKNLSLNIVRRDCLQHRSIIMKTDHQAFVYTWKMQPIGFSVERLGKVVSISEVVGQLEDQFHDNLLMSRMWMNDDWKVCTKVDVSLTNAHGSWKKPAGSWQRNSSMSEIWERIEKIAVSVALDKGEGRVEVTSSTTFTFVESTNSDQEENLSLEEFLAQLKLKNKKLRLELPTTKCTHLDQVRSFPNKGIDYTEIKCEICGDHTEVICLTCYKGFCIRDADHMEKHSDEKQSHSLFSMDCSDVYCAKCDFSFHDLALYKVENAVYLAKYGTDRPWVWGGEIIIQ